MAQLSIEDFSKATDALKHFKRDLNGRKRNKNQFEVKITVKDLDGSCLFALNDVDIIFGYNANYDNIDIMWEPFLGNQYKEQGLYGRYSTTFNKMEYSNKELTIFSEDREIILQG
ncbi:hypothetical protein P5757_26545 [Bacillus tropicus]|uniref:hypothetical protein n=1 Tax=Bacillus tropicus TaxID=2026188 RepID=UPI000B4C143B|nr:hypothetical protein [Bacillus tropicus]MDF9557988.1 hypothetical protein [Bacillus tropicus]MDF9592293.1 hypothetical protein [Bacillus tropicus]MDF9650226.1 hypothetical protein [Bacillus tropicus]